MNTYEILYMDDIMTVVASRKIEADNVAEALRLIVNMTWPPESASISIMQRNDDNGNDVG